MRLSHLFFATLRDDPADAEMVSHRLLLRAGYVRQLGSGIYSLLPLGFRVSRHVEQVIREEMDRIGSQEMEMPVVHPAEIWKESGRYAKIGPELVRFKDRGERDMVLAMTHEEVVALLLRDLVQSYRQLPMMVYHFQTKFRDEPRSRGGLIRVREFVMKDAYSCDRDAAGLDESYRLQYQAYERIFERLGLDAIAVGADVGIMGGSGAHEFMVLNEFGEDTLVLCDQCGYAENQQIAEARKPEPAAEDALPMEDVETPGATTIDALATFLGIPTSRTAKAAFFMTGDGRFVVAIVRGDYDVNETKLVNAIKAIGGLRPATLDEITGRGMQAGYGSPIGAKDAVVVVDELVLRSPNLVAGANRVGWHVKNVNVPRDYTPDEIADLTNAREGDPCIRCGSPLRLSKGIEVGNIFKLGTDFTVPFGATYLGEDGERHPIVMGSYGIGVGRNVACIVEEHHDEKGIVWPAEVAPYAAHLVSIGGAKEPRVLEVAERLHSLAAEAGDRHEILWDDRDESPGVKFTDAELLGMPWILTVSPRSLAAGGIEVTERATGERSTRPIEEVEALLVRGFKAGAAAA
ncbi:MAG TPA: proline--tRNA ligase [Candidatus Limnocylindrales bacterium]|jgi:prolyl-tRNA synthetase|nr:proline--tRNA ligase [Candidatus Limnocylindrales bacterium]